MTCWLLRLPLQRMTYFRTYFRMESRVSRPHVGRPQVVSVRLSHGELEQLTHAAEAAHLPVSTFIRIAAVSHVHAHGEGALADVTRRLARLERAVFERVE